MPWGLPGRWMGGFEFDWYISPGPQKIQIFALKIDTKFVFFLTKSENTFSVCSHPGGKGGGGILKNISMKPLKEVNDILIYVDQDIEITTF